MKAPQIIYIALTAIGTLLWWGRVLLMTQPKKREFRSKVYTDRPAYADFDAPRKFEAIKSIIAKRLTEYPNAICSYSGGSDSDIMLHLIETVRKTFSLPPVQYCFFNTGLEMDAIKRHVREMEKLYGVTITEHRPKKGYRAIYARARNTVCI